MKSGPIQAACERCPARATGTHEELVAASWLPCPRKGGKLAWMCPACNPTTKGGKPGLGLSTP